MKEDKLIKLGKEQNMDLEIAYYQTEETDILTLNQNEESFDIINVKVYNLKALRDGRCAHISVGNLDYPDQIIKQLDRILMTQENDHPNSLSEGSIEHHLEERETIDFQKIKDDMLSLNSLHTEYKELLNIETNYIYTHKVVLITNENSKKFNESAYHTFEINISFGDVANPNTFSFTNNSKTYDFSHIKDLILAKIACSLFKIKATSCETNKYSVLLDKECVTEILNAFKDMFQVKKLVLKTSVLTDQFKKKIFSEKLNIIEDPKSVDAVRTVYFDGEGTPSQYKELIKNGVFIGKMNDLEYALKTNSEPTGNAFGTVNNLFIEPSKENKSLLQELDHGIYIDRVIGIHSGIDLMTGNISLQAEGYTVTNGLIVGGLKMIVLSTNLFELFSNIIEIGSELSHTNMDVLAPDLLLDNITVTGKE